jgi:cytochrome c peroxidase
MLSRVSPPSGRGGPNARGCVWVVVTVMLGVLIAAVLSAPLRAQNPPPVRSLKTITVPKPPDLARYVRDERALVALGKALFWDVQLSSDGQVACATCHFHAGADHRLQNQLATAKDTVERNWTLAPGDFPFKLNFMTAGHRVGSAGMFAKTFVAAGTGGAPDTGAAIGDASYPNIHGIGLRQVTSRNAPSVINAVFNFRNFWDGRASDVFTGWTPFGESDTRANVLVEEGGALDNVRIRIERASLASQAVGPPLDGGEMSYRGRTWPALGRRMLALGPLARQQVAADDSVLGPYANTAGDGLAPAHTYLSLVRAAFQPEYWRSSLLVDEAGARADDPVDKAGVFTQAEYNFALFLGLAIQAYESTLVSDDSPYDRYLDGDRTALTPTQQMGLGMFQRRSCASCHVDPELTLATYSGVFGNFGFPGMGPDAGYIYTGTEAVDHDPGIGGTDTFGRPLSREARVDPAKAATLRGAVKMPSLRNVELTGPYLHTGSKSTLEQIVDFYTSGGDYFTFSLRRWGPDPNERIGMPALMKSFTDDRVRFERAPFDHPELCVPVGHVPDGQGGVLADPADRGTAAERFALVAAVGASGSRVPLQTFDELLLGVGNDGSRAHTLTEPCRRPGVE